jgi:hypothetical protein
VIPREGVERRDLENVLSVMPAFRQVIPREGVESIRYLYRPFTSGRPRKWSRERELKVAR